MSETNIRFFGGLDTIGSNIVSIQHGNYRIISDFGALPEATLASLFNKNQTEQLLNDGHLPKIDGIYSRQQLGANELIAVEESELQTIICLSHLHLDHIGSFGQLSDQVPVYALTDTVEFYHHLANNALLPTFNVNWQSVSPATTFEHGPFKIELIPVDHDTLGAASILITAPDLKIVHSGDWRLTGFEPNKTLNWARKVTAFAPDVLLMEGTTFSRANSEPSAVDLRIQEMTSNLFAKNEMQLMQSLKQAVKQASSKLIAYNGYPQNMQRLLAVAKLMNENGRTLVLNASFYQLMQHYVTPDLQIATYGDKSGVTAEMIQQQPEKYAVQMTSAEQSWILNLPAGVYFHSNGEPLGTYDETYEPYIQRFVDAKWAVVLASATGHASVNDLLLLNRVIAPKLVVPWHTFQPERYAEALYNQGQAVWLPTYNETYTTTDIRLMIGEQHEKN